MLHCAAVQGCWPRLRSNRAGLALTNVRAGARSDVSFTTSRLQSIAIVSGTYALAVTIMIVATMFKRQTMRPGIKISPHRLSINQSAAIVGSA